MSLQMGVTWREPVEGLIEIGRSWDKDGIAWAATCALAALVIAPHLTSVSSAEVYVEATSLAGLASVGEAAGFRPIRGGR